MGTPEFAVPSLEALFADTSYDVIAVYTQPDREAGRGRHLASSPVKELALSRGIEVVQPVSLKDKSVVEHIENLKPDLLVVAAYGRIITPEILCIPEFGCINIHPSLLPHYRGSSPIVEPILQGDQVTGVTIMLLDRGMDTGPILAQKEVPVSDEDTAGSLTEKLAEIGAGLLMETLPRWITGKIEPQPQDESKASYTRIINKEDGEIDWHLPAIDLWRHVRAFNPWPGSYTRWQGKLLRIIEAIPVAAKDTVEEGRVIALKQERKSDIAVGTGDGYLCLIKVQMEGKRVMPADEFVRGQRDFIGSQLG